MALEAATKHLSVLFRHMSTERRVTFSSDQPPHPCQGAAEGEVSVTGAAGVLKPVRLLKEESMIMARAVGGTPVDGHGLGSKDETLSSLTRVALKGQDTVW